MLKETKSNWECVTTLMENIPPVNFGSYVSHWFYKTPRRILQSMTYYKFAAKLIGQNKCVVDVGCNEGLGTTLLAKECGEALGIDFDEEALKSAHNNFAHEKLRFKLQDLFTASFEPTWDAVTCFDMIEHIQQENVLHFFSAIKSAIKPHGMAVIGTPSLISQQFASPASTHDHVNVYDPARFEEEMRRHFEYVFMFAANDEVVHTGFLPLAHYLIAVGCKKIVSS